MKIVKKREEYSLLDELKYALISDTTNEVVALFVDIQMAIDFRDYRNNNGWNLTRVEEVEIEK